MYRGRALWMRITAALLAVISLMSLFEALVFFLTMKNIETSLTASSRNLIDTAGDLSSESLSALSMNRLQELAADKAIIANEVFSDFERAVRTTAQLAGDFYANPNAYPIRSVPLPDASRDGELTVQLLYSEKADPMDPALRKEILLLGNAQDALLSINEELESLASLYIATESGFMIQADSISGRKFDAEGRLLPIEARERPWYRGAAETGNAFFTQDVRDAHTPRLAIMCGVPVYRGEELMGVAGGGVYLEEIEKLVARVGLRTSGDLCILNGDGVVLFSTLNEAPFLASEEGTDLRLSGNAELAAVAADAVARKQGVRLLDIGGKSLYAAYAPMRTIGWSVLVIESQEQVDAAEQALRGKLSETASVALRSANQHIKRAIVIMCAIIAAAVLFAIFQSMRLAQRLASPIRKLTSEVGHIRGDHLDFHWDDDTGDETQLLAESFSSLTERMKTYIRDMKQITAVQERMRTELAMAEKIQRSFLPYQFPPFPDRHEFSLFAEMDPAREIGGDFYDFFLIDDDHLGLVIADVSGKGIPAALLMMVAKTIIRNLAMIGISPAEILENANDSLCDDNPEKMFVTAWVGILTISTGVLTAASAGHEYPAFREAGRAFSILKDRHGFVLGGMRGMRYTDYEIRLQPGAKIFVYTDGVPEATDADNHMFGLERMIAALNADPEAPPEALLPGVHRAVDEFVKDAEQFDDLTMLCLEYRGAAE